MESYGKNKNSSKKKLAILTSGFGAVTTTLFAGIEAVRKGVADPVGSVSQMGKVDGRLIKETLPLARLENLVFGGWDIFSDNAYEAAMKAGVLDKPLLDQQKSFLMKLKPMKGVFDPRFLKRLSGTHVKKGLSKWELVSQLRRDMRQFIRKNQCDRAVMIHSTSTEIFQKPSSLDRSLKNFEAGLKKKETSIAPSLLYAYAALREGIPIANGTPNDWKERPFLMELAEKTNTPYAGCDFKTGQTLLKTIIAPGLQKRLLGVQGWFSTNILGNRDGQVLSDPGSFRAKEISKTSVLDGLLSPKDQPLLYKNIVHLVNINYYPPRGDNKEGWDNIDLFGWLGYPMQLKINFLCRDSILAAPLLLDVALFLDIAKQLGAKGPQDWLSFYFKSPLVGTNQQPCHDLFKQHQALEETLRYWLKHFGGTRDE